MVVIEQEGDMFEGARGMKRWNSVVLCMLAWGKEAGTEEMCKGWCGGERPRWDRRWERQGGREGRVKVVE